MALSNYEESVIEELERVVAELDPAFAYEFEHVGDAEKEANARSKYERRTLGLSAFASLAGVVIMLAYLTTSVLIAFVGATMSLFSALVLLSVYTRSDSGGRL